MFDAREEEQSALSVCRKYVSTPQGHAFMNWLRARARRRMHDAANASQERFPQFKGAYQELESMVKDLEREME